MPRKQITLDGVEGTLELPYGDELPYGGDDSQQVTLEEANPQFISQEDMTLDGISGRLLSTSGKKIQLILLKSPLL